VEGKGVGDGPGLEDAGVFLFVQEPDPAHAYAVVVEVELCGVVDGMTALDLLTDIGKGDLIEGAFNRTFRDNLSRRTDLLK